MTWRNDWGREQVKNNLRSSRLEVIREITKLRLFYFILTDEIQPVLESLEARPQLCRHLIYDGVGIAEQWRKNELFNKRFWVNWLFIWKKWNWSLFKRGRKKFKWMKELDVKNRTIKLLGKHIGKYLYSLEVGKDFFNKVTKGAKLINLTVLKFRTLIHQRTPSRKWKGRPQNSYL